MAGLFPNTEEVWVAKQQVNYDGGGTDLSLHIYKNDYTPVDTSAAGSFTEANFVGYAPITLTGSSWTITGGAPTTAAYATQTFSSTANQTLAQHYGYYLTRGSDYIFGERFTDAPYAIVGLTDIIEVTPNLSYKKQGE